jgi:hypothetical protein
MLGGGGGVGSGTVMRAPAKVDGGANLHKIQELDNAQVQSSSDEVSVSVWKRKSDLGKEQQQVGGWDIGWKPMCLGR